MAMSPRLRRVQRSANAIAGGKKILDELLAEPTKRLLVEAADEGIPPVSRISAALSKLARTERIDIKAMSVRQFVGTAVRAILEDEGYTVAEKGIRLRNDPVFTSGSVYEKRTETEPHQGTLLDRLLGSLSDVEAGRAFAILKERLHTS